MKRLTGALICALMLVFFAIAAADVAPVKMEVPPEAIATQA